MIKDGAFNYKRVGDKKLYEISDKVCAEMFRIADEALENCYAEPKDCFSVAVLTVSGNIYPGVSYVSDTYTLTMHCETVALAHAAVHGEKEVIAITGPNCHMCKQLIYESGLHSGVDVVVVMKVRNRFRKIPISQMMPYPWPAAKR